MKEEHKKLLEEVLTSSEAPAIAFDGCHKIYIALDDEEMHQFEECGYNENDPKMVYLANSTTEEMLSTLIEWYDMSCGLRFVNSVHTVESNRNPNEGFTTLIPQFNDEEE